jgi:hypothetical protein
MKKSSAVAAVAVAPIQLSLVQQWRVVALEELEAAVSVRNVAYLIVDYAESRSALFISSRGVAIERSKVIGTPSIIIVFTLIVFRFP